MPNFKISGTKISRIKERNFDLEKDLQLLTEENLDEIFGLEFVSGKKNKQFIVRNFIIDTLAFDPQSKSLVIIEYKKDESYSVIDQGFNYLSLLFNNKADFVLEFNERLGKALGKNDIQWDQSRVLFVAPSFTPYQLGAISFKDLPFELWKTELFEDGLVSFNQVKPIEAEESIKKVTKNNTINKVSSEIKVFSIEEHYKKASTSTSAMLDEIRARIKQLDSNINEKPVGNYIGFKMSWYNFATIHVFRDKLRVSLRKNELTKDFKKLFQRIPESYKWGKTPLWWIDVKSDKTIDYVMPIIRESYDAAPDK